MRDWIDLHCHLLPGVDDGPQSLEEALELLSGLEDLGYGTIVCTPHQRQGLFMPPVEEIRQKTEDLEAEARRRGHHVRLIPGAENCYDGVFWERVNDRRVPCFGDTKTFLVELPGPPIPPTFEQQVFQWRMAGYLPIFAHVERYGRTPGTVERYRELGENMALAVNMDSIGGMWGRAIARWAKWLLEAGLVHVLTTDSHNAAGTDYTKKGMDWVAKHMGDAALSMLLRDNPASLLAGTLPDPVEPP